MKAEIPSNRLNEKNSEDINQSNDSDVAAEFANIKPNALEVGDDEKIVQVEILDESRLEEYQSRTETSTSCIFESYDEVSRGTTTSSTINNVSLLETKSEFKLNEEITEHCNSSASRSEVCEEREENKAVEFQTINLEDKNEDKTEKSENVAATSDSPPEVDKNKELCHINLDQCDPDETKDVSSDSKDELEVDKDDTNEKTSSEENDKKTLKTGERQLSQNPCEGKMRCL